MPVWIRHIISAVLIAGFITGMAFLGRSELMSRKDLLCERLVVEFADNYRFLDTDDVKSMILDKYGTYYNLPLDSLRVAEIESAVCTHPAITDCQVWTTDNGNLHVRITQRKPAVRFMDGAQGFYADDTGYVFPLYRNFVASAPVVTGPLPKDSLWIAEMSRMAEFISHVWEEKVDSISVNAKGELTLRFGTEEQFKFGQPYGYTEKFRKAGNYLEMVKSPEKNYTTIDLRYDKQIICK